MASFLGHHGIIFGSSWGHFRVIMASFLGHLGVILGSSWHHFWVIMGSFWGHFAIILGSFRSHFGVISRSFWGHFGIILGSFWGHFGIILGSFRGSFLTVFCMIFIIFLYMIFYIQTPDQPLQRPLCYIFQRSWSDSGANFFANLARAMLAQFWIPNQHKSTWISKMEITT